MSSDGRVVTPFNLARLIDLTSFLRVIQDGNRRVESNLHALRRAVAHTPEAFPRFHWSFHSRKLRYESGQSDIKLPSKPTSKARKL